MIEMISIDDFCKDFCSDKATGKCKLTNGEIFYFIHNYGESNFFLDLRDALIRKFGEVNNEFYHTYFSMTYIYFRAKDYFYQH